MSLKEYLRDSLVVEHENSGDHDEDHCEWHRTLVDFEHAIEVEAVKAERARLRQFGTWGDLRRDLQWSGSDPEDHQAIRDERIAKTDDARDEYKAAVAVLTKTYRDRKSVLAEEEWRKHKALEDRLTDAPH
jgi:hypothetical protein